MTYNLAPKNAPWFEQLTDSVRGLGEAAREWQLADQTAALLEVGVQWERRAVHEGKVTGQPGPEARGWEAKPVRRTPHEMALSALQRAYMDHRFFTRRNYERAALLFASGAAWAVRQVRAGGNPDRVVLAIDTDDRRELIAGADFNADLEALQEGRYSNAGKVAAAHLTLMRCLDARARGEELGDHDYITEHEAGEMHDCWRIAEGLADAAYTYGRHAEDALQFALLGPKEEHRRQLAAARAEHEAAAEGGEAP
jgi:hypothetical protein